MIMEDDHGSRCVSCAEPCGEAYVCPRCEAHGPDDLVRELTMRVVTQKAALDAHKAFLDDLCGVIEQDEIDMADFQAAGQLHGVLVVVPATWDIHAEWETETMLVQSHRTVTEHEGTVDCRWCGQTATDDTCIARLPSSDYEQYLELGTHWDAVAGEWVKAVSRETENDHDGQEEGSTQEDADHRRTAD